jgi:hypothetical protein
MYLHNDYYHDTLAEDVDYNTFYHMWPDGSIVEVWDFGFGDVADDSIWINDSGLGYTSVDDRGFIVRLGKDPATDKHWLPGMAKPGDAGFDPAEYYGVFAAAGFGPSRENGVVGDVVHYEYSLMEGTWDTAKRRTITIIQHCTTIDVKITDVPGYRGGIYRETIYDGTLHFIPEPQVQGIALAFAGLLAIRSMVPRRRISRTPK